MCFHYLQRKSKIVSCKSPTSSWKMSSTDRVSSPSIASTTVHQTATTKWKSKMFNFSSSETGIFGFLASGPRSCDRTSEHKSQRRTSSEVLLFARRSRNIERKRTVINIDLSSLISSSLFFVELFLTNLSKEWKRKLMKVVFYLMFRTEKIAIS